MRSLKAVRMLLTVVFNCGDLGEEAQMLGGRDTEGVSVIVHCSHSLTLFLVPLRSSDLVYRRETTNGRLL